MAPPRVAIIGAGFSGIAAAIALTKRGITDYVIFEKNPGIGGTWWANRYPGASVDLESHIYSFSFERHDWTRNYADWHEILGYLESVAEKWGLLTRVRLSDGVTSVAWSDADSSYTVISESGIDHGTFSAVISCVGFLNVPLIPPFARGDHDFEGIICHTAQWPEGVELTDRSVAVLGTGSSAVQVISEAAHQAKDVTIFQIEPNWLLPKGHHQFTERERRLNRNSLVYFWRRRRLYYGYDVRQIGARHARREGSVNRKRSESSRAFLAQSLGDRPDLMALATPEFAFEARRTVISDRYYPALKEPHVHLVPHAVKGLTRTGLIDANGDHHDADLIVLATGFDAAHYLSTFEVRGEGGIELHDVWNGEPQALLGLMVPGFPNFFMMYGPNTNSSPLVSFYEAQAAFAASLIARLKNDRHRRITVRPESVQRFNDWLQGVLATTVWAETDSYFKAGTGRNVAQWPVSASNYILRTKWARRLSVIVD